MLLKRGDNNENVRILQLKLGLSGSGNYGPKTEEYVKDFQLKSKLPVTGIVDTVTWNLISKLKLPILDKIKKLEGSIPTSVLSELPRVINTFGINTELRLTHFLAQCAHESANFSIVRENLNYDSIGLQRVFRRYFPTKTIANAYQRNPQKIANRVYANRMGNGSINSNDGWNFRGRGYIQLTGKFNYNQFGNAIGENLLKNPDKVATVYPLLSAGYFFHINKLNQLSDRGDKLEVIELVTRRVNGGTNGLPDRVRYFRKFHKLLS